MMRRCGLSPLNSFLNIAYSLVRLVLSAMLSRPPEPPRLATEVFDWMYGLFGVCTSGLLPSPVRLGICTSRDTRRPCLSNFRMKGPNSSPIQRLPWASTCSDSGSMS